MRPFKSPRGLTRRQGPLSWGPEQPEDRQGAEEHGRRQAVGAGVRLCATSKGLQKQKLLFCSEHALSS